MASGHKLADYFVISGLDVRSGLEPDRLSGDSLHVAPLDRPYKSHVLAHYPENVPWNPFDESSICMLTHPKGLHFKIQPAKNEARFHAFLITREDGNRTFGAALTFYEKVEDTQICSAMQTLQAMHMAELSNAQSQTLYSHLGHVYSRSPKLFKKPENDNEVPVFDIKKDMLHVTKCICLISQIPLFHTFEVILRSLHQAVVSGNHLNLPLESYVYNLVHEVPLPPPGRSMKFTTYGRTIICQRPSVTEVPLMDFSLKEMLQLIGIDNVLNLLSCMLLEHQILLCSQDYFRLMLVAESVTALMFPFVWQHVYVPILPASLRHFLDAPVPFIMGLHNHLSGHFLSELCAKANMCFVDIDRGLVELPEELPAFPYRDELREDLIQHINLHSVQQQHHHAPQQYYGQSNESLRDSGFRDSYIESDLSSSSSSWSIPSKIECLQQNEALAKITALAKKTGVISSLDDIRDLTPERRDPAPPVKPDKHLADLTFNNSIREVFLHYFMQIFFPYESFVIQPTQDMESWLSNRETMQNFDKAAFLSDQPEAHLPFLSAFIETQMFTTLIDNKILSQWEDPDPNLRVFDARLRNFRETQADQRLLSHHRYSWVKDTESVLEKRATVVDLVAPSPHNLDGFIATDIMKPGTFPLLNSKVLNKEPTGVGRSKRDTTKWRKRDRGFQHSEHLRMGSDKREKYIQEARTKNVRQPKLCEMNPAAMAHTNWKFVETLLKECKTKTKRMLVEKMGQEAVELGHGELTITGVEENTLIASLCDLLERIWSHGMHGKQGKSALWSHLLSFQEVEECNDKQKPIDPNLLTPDLSNVALEGDGCPSGTQTWPVRRHRRKASRGPELPVLNPIPVSVTYDMRNIQQMSEIKTAVGYARAWVRLSLEKKLLSTHLKELLSNADLLKSLYKRYAFLRCEDEREQFLYHLLSLNAVDYHCFTNTFTNTIISYRILVFPRIKLSGGTTTANCWLSLAGQLGETETIQLPKHTLDITVKNKNLGVLTTMRIGHDNAGMSPKWMVEHVLVRNEVTGQTYRFPCGRWLGKGVDDGSIERLLVAEAVPPMTDHSELMEKCRTPPRCRSPSLPRKSNEPKLQLSDIQEMLGDAVNNLVKHFYKPEKERGSITGLLCGEYGLVYCMEHVFQCGFKSARLFRNRFYIWDFLEKVEGYFETLLQEADRYHLHEEARHVLSSFTKVIVRINQASETVGKDGRFQLFVCIGVRDHMLQKWIKAMSKTPVTSNMYEEKSFVRDPSLVMFLVQILDSLNEFTISLETSLTRGIEI